MFVSQYFQLDFELDADCLLLPEISLQMCFTTFQVLFSCVPGGSSRIGVKPANSNWGVCTFMYSKATPPVPALKCLSCGQKGCVHVGELHKAIDTSATNEPGPITLFRDAFSTSPALRSYYELVARSDSRVLLYERNGKYQFVNNIITQENIYLINAPGF